MRAARVHEFGSPTAIVVEELPRPDPEAGEVLPLEQARKAHEMLAGGRPRKRGRIVLAVR
jgi:hypothetical protein